MENVLEREWLEVETVGCVIVGRDRLRITVHHDRLEAFVLQSESRVAAAAIEFDPLSYPVRTTAENHDLLAVAGFGLILFLIRRVEVWRVGFEFCSARIDAFVDRSDRIIAALPSNVTRFRADEPRDSSIGKAGFFGFAQKICRQTLKSVLRNQLYEIRDFSHFIQKPRVDVRQLDKFGNTEPTADRIQQIRNAIRRRRDQLVANEIFIDLFRSRILGVFERPHRLEKSFFECPADRHHFADGLHLRSKRRIGVRKFFECPFGNFDNDVIEHRLERGGSFLRDIVWDLVQRVADGQLRCNLCNGKTGSLRSQRRTARHARVHFDDDEPAVLRIHGKLDIRSAGLDTNLANNCDGGVAQPLVLAIGQSLRGGNGYRVAGMYTHWIEVFDRTDDNDVVLKVAHHFELELFPSDDGLFDKHCVDRTQIEPALNDTLELFAVKCDATPSPAQRE